MIRRLTAIIVVIVFLASAWYACAYDLPKWFPFNRGNALKEWQEKIFRNRVMYVVQSQRGQGYLAAKSEQACSGLIYRIAFNAGRFPMISWEWRVKQFPQRTTKGANDDATGWVERDDYAARLYVIFPSWNFLNTKCIEYVWDETMPVGTVMASPYSKNIKLIVVESGRKNMNTWVSEKRNIIDDYQKAFGRRVRSVRVGAIALMTDSDNTVSTAEAFYRNIKVGYRNE